MYMIFIRSYFMSIYFISQAYSMTYFFQRRFNLFSEYRSAIFHWTYKMIQKQVLIVALYDVRVFLHLIKLTKLLPLCDTRGRASGNSTD